MAIGLIYLLLNFTYKGFYGIDPKILKAIAQVESGENIRAKHINKNGTVDYGLMQINTYWVERLGLDTMKLLSDPYYSMFWSSYILRTCFDKYGFTVKGLGCYHSLNDDRALTYALKVIKIYTKQEKPQ